MWLHGGFTFRDAHDLVYSAYYFYIPHIYVDVTRSTLINKQDLKWGIYNYLVSVGIYTIICLLEIH